MAADSSVRVQLRLAREQLAGSSAQPERDASLLLARVLGKDRAWLWTHPDALLADDHQQLFHALLQRRSRHEPMQYILGEQEFYSLGFEVTPAVLIPRPETELLVEAVLRWAPRDRPLRIVDVGTGSGAIAVSLAHALPASVITAVDLSAAALEVAGRNAARHGVVERVRLLRSDLLSALPGVKFDAVVSNPPYVSTGETLEPQVRLFEPPLALYAGETGLDVYRALIPRAAAALLPNGLLALEIGAGQQPALEALLRAGGRFSQPTFGADLQGIPRVLTATRHANG